MLGRVGRRDFEGERGVETGMERRDRTQRSRRGWTAEMLGERLKKKDKKEEVSMERERDGRK